MIKINFKYQNEDEIITIDAAEGLSLLEVAHQNNLDLEGACEGSLACATCHVILEPEYYKKLPAASDDEEDMLDLAFGLTHTSRLGCQILVNKELENMIVIIPSTTRNITSHSK